MQRERDGVWKRILALPLCTCLGIVVARAARAGGPAMSCAAIRNATLAVLLAAAPAPAETFHNKDGVVFEGTIRLVVSNAAVCNVLEEKYTAQEYEQLKANQGQPLDLWQVDFAVRNESGREIEYLRASRRVHSEHPPCTNWSGEGPGGGPVLPEPSLLISTGWGDYYQVLQRPSGMRPGQQERSARYLVVFHEHQPRFGEWDIDYTFAKEAGAGKEPAAGASPDAGERGGDVHGVGGLRIAGEPVLAVDHEQHGGGGLRGVSAPVSERHLSGPGTESAGGLARVGRAASSQGRRNRRGRRSKDGRLGSAPGRLVRDRRKARRAGRNWSIILNATSGIATTRRTRPRHGLGSVPRAGPRGRERSLGLREVKNMCIQGSSRTARSTAAGSFATRPGPYGKGPMWTARSTAAGSITGGGASRKGPMWTASGTAAGSFAGRTGPYGKRPMWTASGTAAGSFATRPGP